MISVHSIWSKTLHSCTTRVIAGNVMKAFTAIHQLYICHRDIRSNNVLIGENNSVWVIDFGFSRIVHGRSGETQLNQEMDAVRMMLEDLFPRFQSRILI